MGCSFSILAGTPDVPFLEPMVKHIVGANCYPFSERILVLDVLPPAQPESRGNDEGRRKQLERIGQHLQSEGWIDEVLKLRVDEPRLAEWKHKHFTEGVNTLRDERGIPLFGWIAGIEASTDDRYHVHFDSDIFLFQKPDFDWVQEGLHVMKSDPSALFMAPRPGPPTPAGDLRGQSDEYVHDRETGVFQFKTFSSRRFLVDKERLRELLPLDPLYISRRDRLVRFFTGESTIQPWEAIVSHALKQSSFYRGHLSTENAWVLHAPDHGPSFISHLSELVQTIEGGSYPEEQAGYYDLRLNDWVKNDN